MLKAKQIVSAILASVVWVWVVGALMVATSGCGARVHIHPDHGKSLKRHFLMQRIFPEAAEGNLAGLDSEEAAMIHGTYRKQFGGGSAQPDPSSRVLVLQEGKGGTKK